VIVVITIVGLAKHHGEEISSRSAITGSCPWRILTYARKNSEIAEFFFYKQSAFYLKVLSARDA
jgi:hypothetical protein